MRSSIFDRPMVTKIGFGRLVAVMILSIVSSTSISALNSQIDQFPEFLEINLNTGGQLRPLASQSHVEWLHAVPPRHETRHIHFQKTDTVMNSFVANAFGD